MSRKRGARLPKVRRASDDDAPASICPACDVLLWDGVAYTSCPACNRGVDAVDPELPVWCCRGCDKMINAVLDARPRCESCDRAMVAAFAGSRPSARGLSLQRFSEETLATPTGLTLLWVGMLLPLASLALHPVYRWFVLGLAPVLIVPVIFGASFLANLVSAIPELRALARDRRLRVVHGFEHATAHILEAEKVPVRWGHTDADGSFELAMERGEKAVDAPAFRRALEAGISRIRAGETALAFHPRCGSTWIALFALGAFLSILVAVLGLFAQLSPAALGGLVGLLIVAMIFGSQPLGHLLQRYVSVDTRFHRARVLRVTLAGTGDRDVVYKAELAVAFEAGHDTAPKPIAVRALPESKEVAPAKPPRVREPMVGVRCPDCSWVPEKRDLWKCECGWKWNPFTTDGQCPACAHHFPETKCLSCKKKAAQELWRVPDTGSNAA